MLVVIGDTHIGSSTALSPLKFSVHNRNTLEAQTTEANRLQRWLYSSWTDFWNYVKSTQDKKRIIVVHLGDVVDGNHHGSAQLVQEINDQIEMAVDLLEPVRDIATVFIGILGTVAHSGPEHSTELEIYRRIGADYIEQQFTANIDGVLADFAHHGRAGSRPWTSGAANQTAEIIIDYAQSGDPLPNYIFRGHRHIFDDSGAKFENTRLVQCPSWQLRTNFANQVAGTTRRSDIGGIILSKNGLDLSKSRYKGQPDRRKIIEL